MTRVNASYDADLIQKVYDDYRDRIEALLRRVRVVCQGAGLHCPREPYDLSDDTYRWSLVVFRGPEKLDEQAVDITVEIAEAQSYGDEPENGINFGLDIVEWGGRILGGLAPFNYTPQCWVDANDSAAVAERWQILEDADLSTVPALVRAEEGTA